MPPVLPVMAPVRTVLVLAAAGVASLAVAAAAVWWPLWPFAVVMVIGACIVPVMTYEAPPWR